MRLWSDRVPSDLRKWRLIPKLVEEGVIEAESEEEDTVSDTDSEDEEIDSEEGAIEADSEEEDTVSDTDLEDEEIDSEDWDKLNETVSWPDTEDELDWEGL